MSENVRKTAFSSVGVLKRNGVIGKPGGKLRSHLPTVNNCRFCVHVIDENVHKHVDQCARPQVERVQQVFDKHFVGVFLAEIQRLFTTISNVSMQIYH
jgi:hypothetical protein